MKSIKRIIAVLLVFAALVSLTACTSAEAEREELLMRYFDAWRSGSYSPYSACFYNHMGTEMGNSTFDKESKGGWEDPYTFEVSDEEIFSERLTERFAEQNGLQRSKLGQVVSFTIEVTIGGKREIWDCTMIAFSYEGRWYLYQGIEPEF